MVKRHIEDLIKEKLFKGKAIFITGPRQTGKTTLLKKLFSGKENVVWLNMNHPEF